MYSASCLVTLLFLAVRVQSGWGRGVGAPGHQKGNEVPGQGYRRCGHYKCLNLGVVCDKGKCDCKPGTVGDGRIQCADPDDHCLCTIHGDPHIVNFQGDLFTLPLPCSHVIADLTTPATPDIAGGCKLFISGRARYGGGSNVDVSYENQIDIYLLTTSSKFTTRITTAGFSMTKLSNRQRETWEDVEITKTQGKGNAKADNQRGKRAASAAIGKGGSNDLDIDVQTDTDDAGFHRVIVPACGMAIKYRAQDGSFSLQTPIKSAEQVGLCGACDHRWNKTRSHHYSSKDAVLQLLLNSLWGRSPIDLSDTNIYPSCTKLTSAVHMCPVGRKSFAAGFCGQMLTNQKTEKCLSAKLGSNQDVQEVFTACYERVCNQRQPCSNLRNLYRGCDQTVDLTSWFNDAKFCRKQLA